MALNPLVYTENVLKDFLRYQLSAYPLADQNLYQQLRNALSLEKTRNSPLVKGPFVSLSRSFKPGAKVSELVREGVFHSHMQNLISYSSVYGHQEKAIRGAKTKKTVLVSTGTGSGKTECFMYPIISRCLELRDQGAKPGVAAVIVYPMNALAEDQLGRLRGLLAGSGISFGMYVGKTPRSKSDVNGIRLEAGASKESYRQRVEKVQKDGGLDTVIPSEERASREEMKESGGAPRILLTNVKQLELLLTRGEDIEMFKENQLEFIVFDEAHTFSGAAGSETALLIRRLKAFCGKSASDVTCIATSATIADPEKGDDPAFEFASRFFGVDKKNVILVKEDYEAQVWNSKRSIPKVPTKLDPLHVANLLAALDKDHADGLNELLAPFEIAVGTGNTWRADLFDVLVSNELLYQANEALAKAGNIFEVAELLSKSLNRSVSVEELVCNLALGAAAKKNDRHLLRPVVHVFMRGIGGAVVTFDGIPRNARLWLSSSEASEHYGSENLHFKFDVSACTRCGQHYYSHKYADLQVTDGGAGGGSMASQGTCWQPVSEGDDGVKAYFIDRQIGDDEDSEGESDNTPAVRTHQQLVHLCAFCGTMHSSKFDACTGCGRDKGDFEISLILQSGDDQGSLKKCISCKKQGIRREGSFKEPVRTLRATHVSDIHVIGQSMLQHAEVPRLLIFADSRQDAAFQAGWMKDHARRFRLRAMMNKKIQQGDTNIAEVVSYLERELDKDNEVSFALIPEVWEFVKKSDNPREHAAERKKFLKIQVLREVTSSPKERIGLEPWGRMKINYEGLSPDAEIIQKWSVREGIDASELFEGVLSAIDYYRRKVILLDRDYFTFSKPLSDGDSEVQRGYINKIQGLPRGLTLDGNGPRTAVQAFYSTLSWTRQKAKVWGVNPDHVEEFWQEIWEYLTIVGIFVPSRLYTRANSDTVMRGSVGSHQIDSNKIILSPFRGVYACASCGTRTHRNPPQSTCVAWRCEGKVSLRQENPDNYDLSLLDGDYILVRPQEHSAQVPNEKREEIERSFKDESSTRVNALVCTPTLEMGIDIGNLDSVLMRNVPPAASNYWQRAGRAGRRARMAVNLTYARNVSHDQEYFEDPTRILSGKIESPQINLRNELMVNKHIRACVLTQMNVMANSKSGIPTILQDEITHALDLSIPKMVAPYLFNEQGGLLNEAYDLSRLQKVIDENTVIFEKSVWQLFEEGWPQEAAHKVTKDSVRGTITSFPADLSKVIESLRARVRWLVDQIDDFNKRSSGGRTLTAEEEGSRYRYNKMLNRYKGQTSKSFSENEGVDDFLTMSVLAGEGFLPGYGLETGSVRGQAQVQSTFGGQRDFTLPRPPAVALREYVPGNAIYANGNRFTPKRFKFNPEQDQKIDFVFDVEREFAEPVNAGPDKQGILTAYHIPDVDMPLISSIKDDEEFRFRLSSVILGAIEKRHNGGSAYRWGTVDMQLLKALHMKLLNIGPTRKVSQDEFGYNICSSCGQSVSPFSSQEAVTRFIEDHQQRHGQAPRPIGLYAKVVADSLVFNKIENRLIAYTLLEGIRKSAAEILRLEEDDFEILVVGRSGEDEVDAYLYDPIAGGSGNLEELIQRWPEVVVLAKNIFDGCRAQCEKSCSTCLLSYWNQPYHKYLDRKQGSSLIASQGGDIEMQYEIVPVMVGPGVGESAETTNRWEDAVLRLLRAARLPEPIGQHEIDLGKGHGRTLPDFYYELEDNSPFAGLCIYFDGIHHDRPENKRLDNLRRTRLEELEYKVIAIPYEHLGDDEAMMRHIRSIASVLKGRAHVRSLTDDTSWLKADKNEVVADDENRLSRDLTILPYEEGRVEKDAVPYFDSIKIAAGKFGEESVGEPIGWIKIDRKGDLGDFFAARITGTSMEPRIPDGAICLFRIYRAGSRQGKIMLIERRGLWSQENGGDFVIKKYRRTTVIGDSEDRSGVTIELISENPEFPPIVLSGIGEEEISTPAEFVSILKK